MMKKLQWIKTKDGWQGTYICKSFAIYKAIGENCYDLYEDATLIGSLKKLSNAKEIARLLTFG